MWLLVAFGPAIAAWMIIAFLRRSSLAARFVDRPNERSLHEVPTPRIGGIGLVAVAIAFAAAWATYAMAAVLAAAAFLALLSLVDDLRALPISVRLPAHVAAAMVVVLAIASPGVGHSGLDAVQCAIVVIVIAWMTNLYNFMDGADGLAGGMALIGFATYAIAAGEAGNVSLAVTSACVASAAAGFLAHNFPPARVFMGDAGSIPLGFLAASLGLAGYVQGTWPAWFPLAVFAAFIVDATLTLGRRVARGERFWKAHRTHAYQRLALGGMPRRTLAISAYAVMSLTSLAALAALACEGEARSGIIVALFAAYGLLFAAIELRVKAH